MMFSEMQDAGLYPPQYRESSLAAGDCLTVVLLTEPKDPLWDRVSEWIDRNGPLSNSTLCRLGKLHKVKASRQLKKWTDIGLLQMSESQGWRNRVYAKTNPIPGDVAELISDVPEINSAERD